MTLVKYFSILDDGRRCRSCCNRANLFGLRDHGSGWEGDCAECNIRWYKGQVMSTCRHLRTMLLSNSLFGLEGFPTQQVQQFANLDLDFYRRGVDFKRQVRVLTETFTNVVDSDDEYFDSCAVALAKFPLSLLSEIPLGSSAYACSLLKGLPCMRLSLLHVIATFLLPPPRRRGAGRTAHVQSHDYVQTVWRKIRHRQAMAGECRHWRILLHGCSFLCGTSDSLATVCIQRSLLVGRKDRLSSTWSSC